ncbi:unnamed protein product, partial [Mesorhabditis belari]|uniref:Uncharacterized protein n=1 Tax=Mesorhabditis belari TaxID=2138241 RepID=A0AAF3F853_9BILA
MKRIVFSLILFIVLCVAQKDDDGNREMKGEERIKQLNIQQFPLNRKVSAYERAKTFRARQTDKEIYSALPESMREQMMIREKLQARQHSLKAIKAKRN